MWFHSLNITHDEMKVCDFIVLSTMLSFWFVAHTVTKVKESDQGSVEVRFTSITPGSECCLWARLTLWVIGIKGTRQTKVF